jgi:hypothetical protein
MAPDLDAFGEVWVVHSESAAPPGERPSPLALAARELRAGRTILLGGDDHRGRREPPYPVGPEVLLVAFEAPAVLGCHLALGWPMPARMLDLAAEFRCRTAGLLRPHGPGLLGALSWYGLDVLDAARTGSPGRTALPASPGPPGAHATAQARCAARVGVLARLLAAMAPELDLPRALLRGRYTAAVARMEWVGVPIDVPMLDRLRAGWESIKDRLIRDVDRGFGVFVERSFRPERWATWVERRGLPWPRLESDALALDDETFREMARSDADVSLMRELRVSLSQLRAHELAVGPDGRNRCPLRPFASKTGRNQPSGTRFIFGPARWLRGLIKPGPGRAVAYLDWEQQEFGIAAALASDAAMMAAYLSGDPYLSFAIQAGQAPADATRETHGPTRELFKACVLGVQYGMGERTLAQRIGRPAALARTLLRLHRETYPKFWAWSDGAEHHAILLGQLPSVFGWTVHVGPEVNPRSLRNFPCQANGAEMMRLACCLATERGVEVCAPVHDALLVEGPADTIKTVVEQTRRAMDEASELVLSGFRLRTEARVVRWPERYMDGRGRGMWERVARLLDEPGIEARPPRVIRLRPSPRGPVRK